MPQLSVTIITRNEEKNLGRCIESVPFADEFIVVDSGSTDGTRLVAEKHGAQFFEHEWKGFGAAKQEAVRRATGKWILSLDADEALSPELAGLIQAAIARNDDTAGYYMKRKTLFLGRWIKHCGWYPDYVLRLFRKDSGNFNDSFIHEKVIVNGPTAKLNGDILHFCYETVEQYLQKSNRYTTIGAREAFIKGKRARWFDFTARPVFSFLRHYIFKLGIFDGYEGLILSFYSAQAVLHKYNKLRQYERQGLSGGDDYAA